MRTVYTCWHCGADCDGYYRATSGLRSDPMCEQCFEDWPNAGPYKVNYPPGTAQGRRLTHRKRDRAHNAHPH